MPGMPKFLTVWPVEDSEKMYAQDQKVFQSEVRMLLYLVRRLRPNIANATQDLAKVNDVMDPEGFCELHHVVDKILLV